MSLLEDSGEPLDSKTVLDINASLKGPPAFDVLGGELLELEQHT